MPDESAKHTPGPWTYHIGLDYTIFRDANDNPIFEVPFVMDELLARLIAASQELLEACQAAVKTIRDDGSAMQPWESHLVSVFESAIAKATIEG